VDQRLLGRLVRIRDRQACWVTFITIIEAEDETEAYNFWCDGDLGNTDTPPEIGDSISDWPGGTDVLPFTEAEPSPSCEPIRPDLAVRACELLVAAYRRGLADGAEVEWEDLDEAAALAAEAVGADLNEALEEIDDALAVPADDAQTTIARREIP
jgi:hypothetical protein